jgi:hypothetical protein
MKFFVSVLLTALLAFALCLRFDWWMIAVAAFIVSFAVPQKPGKALLAGFSGIFLLWAVLSVWMKSQGGDLIGAQVARILPLGGNQVLLILITGFVGGLVGGSAALTGSLGRRMF